MGRPSLHVVPVRNPTWQKHRHLVPADSKRLLRFLNKFIFASPQTAVIGSVRTVCICCNPCAICECRFRDNQIWLAAESLQLRSDFSIKCLRHDASCSSNKCLIRYLSEAAAAVVWGRGLVAPGESACRRAISRTARLPNVAPRPLLAKRALQTPVSTSGARPSALGQNPETGRRF